MEAGAVRFVVKDAALALAQSIKEVHVRDSDNFRRALP
jgi:hypothetical protein